MGQAGFAARLRSRDETRGGFQPVNDTHLAIEALTAPLAARCGIPSEELGERYLTEVSRHHWIA
jgi:hypothetical protein